MVGHRVGPSKKGRIRWRPALKTLHRSPRTGSTKHLADGARLDDDAKGVHTVDTPAEDPFMDTWRLVLVLSALSGGRVQSLGTITIQNKEACLAALRTINTESARAIGGSCISSRPARRTGGCVKSRRPASAAWSPPR